MTASSFRTALVTGASDGIGRALAIALARRGTLVVLCARRRDKLERLAIEIEAAGGSARVEPLDVADTDGTVALMRLVDKELDGLDLIVANAGRGSTVSARKLTWEKHVEPLFRVNTLGAIATLTAVLPEMLRRDRGHLVGISSLAAYRGLPSSAAYSGSKAGLSTFLESLRLDLRGTGVRTTAVHPGFVETAMTEGNDFTMPFLMSAPEAAKRILSAIDAGQGVLDFPLPTALAMRAATLVPRPLWERMAKKPSRKR